MPVFMRLQGKRALFVGDSSLLARKLHLLEKCGCQFDLICDQPDEELSALINAARVTCIKYSDFQINSIGAYALIVCDHDSSDLTKGIIAAGKERNIPVNVVNNSQVSDFIFPSVIDRSPVIAAVSSSGQIPVLTRLLRNVIEATIPFQYGRLAEIAASFRKRVNATYKESNQRRLFWERHLSGHFSELVFSGKEKEAEKFISNALDKDDHSAIGEVYLVGAGPGDPDLLTFRALRLIRQADVVVYDRLVSEPIMSLCRQDAKLIHVGKARSDHTLPQEEINKLLVKLAREGNRVVRLKGGDPFIFGRGGEEIQELAEFDVPFQVVPGITAASGCASYSGIPLTHRDHSQSVRFITGHLKNDTCDLPWNEFSAANQTLVFYMGLTALSVITRELIAHGMSASTPIALISKGTTPEQEVLTSTLSDIVERTQLRDIKAPTLIIIGEVVRLRDKLRWFD